MIFTRLVTHSLSLSLSLSLYLGVVAEQRDGVWL